MSSADRQLADSKLTVNGLNEEREAICYESGQKEIFDTVDGGADGMNIGGRNDGDECERGRCSQWESNYNDSCN